MTEKNYFVLLTDLIGSRSIDDRENGTLRLKKAIRDFNLHFQNIIFAPMEITRGDEAASVLNRIDTLNEMISRFTANLSPFRCRFVITYGPLTAGLSNKRSTEIDGPAFYDADAAMKQLKKTSSPFHIKTGNAALDSGISSLVSLTLLREHELTPFQSRVVQLFLKGKKQREIAKEVKRTQQQISQVKKVVPIEVLREAWTSITLLTHELQKQLRGGRTYERSL